MQKMIPQNVAEHTSSRRWYGHGLCPSMKFGSYYGRPME